MSPTVVLCSFFIFYIIYIINILYIFRFRHWHRFKSIVLAPVSEETQTIPNPTFFVAGCYALPTLLSSSSLFISGVPDS